MIFDFRAHSFVSFATPSARNETAAGSDAERENKLQRIWGVFGKAVQKAEVKARAGDARLFDAGGRTVVPGFIDAHTHMEVAVSHQMYAVDARARAAVGGTPARGSRRASPRTLQPHPPGRSRHGARHPEAIRRIDGTRRRRDAHAPVDGQHVEG